MTTVTLATWNCARLKAEKAIFMLSRFSPSVIALQECSAASVVPGDVRWAHENDRQQVLVSVDAPLRIGSSHCLRTTHYLACEIKGPIRFNVVSVWTLPKGNKKYTETVKNALTCLTEFIASAPTILAGDFNISKRLDRERYDEIAVLLASTFGLVSAYHVFFKTQPGAEVHQTHRHSSGSLHHIDYVFIPESWTHCIQTVEVGSFSESLGDHVPLIVTFDAEKLKDETGPAAGRAVI